MSTTDNSSFARSLRSQWRNEEEELTLESFEFTKRSMGLPEYLANVSNEGYSISIASSNNRYEGTVSFIGSDFFTLTHNTNIRTSFPVYENFSCLITIGTKLKDSKKVVVEPKSFKALIDELVIEEFECDLELVQNKQLHGKMEIFKDFLRMKDNNSKKSKESFIESNSVLFATKSIVSLSIKLIER